MSHCDHINTLTTRRLRLGGCVQGVGFRPFVSRSAYELGITGTVCNRGGEVEIVAQSDGATLEQFLHRLLSDPPALAKPILLTDEFIDACRYDSFAILASQSDDESSVKLPLDQPLCSDCRRELNDPSERRYCYPFINCTQCGPRYTLIDHLPYDRANTSMAGFALCDACASEYRDINNRRYHAEPIACPVCGPSLCFITGSTSIKENGHALAHAVTALKEGAILAVKGIGGYHLMCDASNENTVTRLRKRKQRPAKPLAVMFPWRGSDGIDAVSREVETTPIERERLISSEFPIVLCKRRANSILAPSIAPGLNEVGVLLPYSPLHHLMLDQFGGPLVATSANISGEPVLSDNGEVQQRLSHIADAFLHHNRPIVHPADDSLYRTIGGNTRPLRLGRGSAPRELPLPFHITHPLLAVGGHLKNTIALAWNDRVILSPHIGDLDTPRGMQLFADTIMHLRQIYNISIEAVTCDAHPGYASTRWAQNCGLPVTTVLHHHAHASALYGEHHGEKEWLIFTWDGTGYGGDNILWGGESFIGTPGKWQHYSSLLPFHLPGGEKAARQPWRSALALCWEAGRDWPQATVDTSLLRHAWQHRVNSPASSGMGRLFDGAAALLGLCHDARYEGEAAMLLEAIAEESRIHGALPLVISEGSPLLIDWQALLPLLFDETITIGQRAGGFHQILADTITAIAIRAREHHGIDTVGLSGGVFQNRLLSELASKELMQHGFIVKLSTRIPCNDGGIAFGQVIDYLYRQEKPVNE